MTASITGQNNPYIIGVPIDDAEFFFGREDLFQFIQDNLKQNAQVILLHGQRRIGKSSILHQIHNFIQLEEFCIVFLSLEGKSKKAINNVLHEIAVEIKDYLEDEFELQVDKIIPPSPNDLQKDQQLFSKNFLTQVFEVIGDKNLVLLLDEFDVLGEHSQDTASIHLFPYLKSLVDEQEKLFIIPVVGRRLDDMPNLISLFHQAPNKRIGLLQEQNAKRLIIEPAKGVLEYNSDAIQAILELSSGHPYFTQLMCFAIFSKARNEGKSKVTREDVESVVDKAIEIGEGGLTWFYDGLSISERVVLSSVAEAQKIAGLKEVFTIEEPLTLLRKYGVTQTKLLAQAAEKLVKWDFLELAEVSDLPANKAPTYKVKIELVRRWLVKRYPLQQEIRELQKSPNQGIINYYDPADSFIITGDSNLATITNYYYREDINVIHIGSTDAADENLPCPYRGLFHFGANDAEFFFGREVFIKELVAATLSHNFIPVLGASGSGKSSVVMAGLVPNLQQTGHWLFTHFRPGFDPFHTLAEALVPLYITELDATNQIVQARKLAKYFEDGSILLQDVLSEIRKNYPNHRVLLIADQFEELYTLCADQNIRHSFLDTLLASFQSSHGNTNVLVATMRSDFLGNALSYRPFADVLQNAYMMLGAMNRQELSQVIEKPAEKLGVKFEAGLVKRILDDVENQPGILPLLQFTLTELWNKRTGKQLTHKNYQEIGQVEGALFHYADNYYEKFSDINKEQARQIFIQLVRPGVGTEDTRRLATKAELGETNWALVKQLADARLVVTSRNIEYQETVEVVHESLIRHWHKLRQWMDTERSFRAWQERLRAGMHEWQVAQRDEEALLRGAALANAEEKLKQRQDDLSKDEQDFIEASLAVRDREYQQRKRARRVVLLGLTGGFVSALSLSGLGLWQYQQLEIAKIRVLNATAKAQFASDQQLDGLIVSLRSGKALQRNLWKQNSELNNQVIKTLQIVDEIKERNRLEGSQGWVTSVSFSPDGKLLASRGENGTVQLWNLQGKQLQTFNVPKGSVNSVSFSPDGKLLASGGENGTVQLWNLQGKQLQTFNVSKGSVNSVSFSPDGKLLASGGENGTVQLWNLQGKQLQTFNVPKGSVNSVSFSPDGKLLASGGENGTVQLWNLQGKQLQTFNVPKGSVNSVSFSPDGKLLASGGENGTVQLWNLQGKQLQTFNVPKGSVNSVSFSPDGKLLATAGADGTARLWDVSSRQQLEEFKVPQGMLNATSFSPDGKLLATAGENGIIRLWSLQNQQLPVSTGNQLDRLLIRGCNWARNYLENNPNVTESDRSLCNDIN